MLPDRVSNPDMTGRVGHGVAAYPEQIHCHTLPCMYPYHILGMGWVRVRIGLRNVGY